MPKRFAVIGTGLWGGMHAKTYRDHTGAELAAVCDLNAERASAVASECGAPKACSDWRDIATDAGIDAVSVVTPDFAHADIVVACAQAGKHVLVEKPMATTVAECEQMIAAANGTGAKLMVDFHNRWNPSFHLAYQAIRNGEIGRPRLAYCRLSNTTYVPLKMLSWAAKSSPLWFLGSHAIDAVCWMLGEWPDQVRAVSRRELLKKMGVDAPDFFLSTLEFPSGAVATIENSWIIPESFPTICEFVCEIIGSEGRLDLDTLTNRALQLSSKDGHRYQDLLGGPIIFGKQMGFAVESIKHFTDCVIEDKPPLVPAEDGLEVTRIACAIEDSAATGQPVALSR